MIFPDDIEKDADCAGTWPFSSCSGNQVAVVVLMALYLIFANIMLVNMLVSWKLLILDIL